MEYLIHQAKHSEIRGLVSHNDHDYASFFKNVLPLSLSRPTYIDRHAKTDFPKLHCWLQIQYTLASTNPNLWGTRIRQRDQYFLSNNESRFDFILPFASLKWHEKKRLLELILDFAPLRLNQVAPGGRDIGETWRARGAIRLVPWESYIRTYV